MQSFYGGPRGPKGEQGLQGVKGDPGTNGTNLTPAMSLKTENSYAEDNTLENLYLAIQGETINKNNFIDGKFCIVTFGYNGESPKSYGYGYNKYKNDNNEDVYDEYKFFIGVLSDPELYTIINDSISNRLEPSGNSLHIATLTDNKTAPTLNEGELVIDFTNKKIITNNGKVIDCNFTANSFQPGDLITTATSKSLEDGWLLCNGQTLIYNPNGNPEIINEMILNHNFLDFEEVPNITDPDIFTPEDFNNGTTHIPEGYSMKSLTLKSKIPSPHILNDRFYYYQIVITSNYSGYNDLYGYLLWIPTRKKYFYLTNNSPQCFYPSDDFFQISSYYTKILSAINKEQNENSVKFILAYVGQYSDYNYVSNIINVDNNISSGSLINLYVLPSEYGKNYLGRGTDATWYYGYEQIIENSQQTIPLLIKCGYQTYSTNTQAKTQDLTLFYFLGGEWKYNTINLGEQNYRTIYQYFYLNNWYVICSYSSTINNIYRIENISYDTSSQKIVVNVTALGSVNEFFGNCTDLIKDKFNNYYLKTSSTDNIYQIIDNQQSFFDINNIKNSEAKGIMISENGIFKNYSQLYTQSPKTKKRKSISLTGSGETTYLFQNPQAGYNEEQLLWTNGKAYRNKIILPTRDDFSLFDQYIKISDNNSNNQNDISEENEEQGVEE